ncbi:response regulator, partial [Candidatus Sumerlaeota bacterium]|nr:response regulator [Candidatus Sumerlaeota bacterium]
MAGERILLVDSSAAVQEIGKIALEEAGFRVSTGSNGPTVLAAPETEKFDVIVVDAKADGLDGYLVTRELKAKSGTHTIPVLLLIPEEEAEPRGSQTLRGANGYVLKPFRPAALVGRVNALIEEKAIKEQCDGLLREAAHAFMDKLAEQHIREAAEKRTQLIVERSIQTIVTQLDQQIRQEVGHRMTTLTAEKEEELVRATVREVAQSMVEKLAERKVAEAIQTVLNEVTEKTVKKAADTHIPAQARRLIKESLDAMLPREVGNQVQKSIESAL